MAEETSGAGTGSKTPSRQAKLRYQDRIDVAETFADSIKSCVFDGQQMRIEFTVARFDDPGALGVLEGRQVPVARMVLSRTAVADLLSRFNQLANVLKQAGVPAGERAAADKATKN